MTTSVLSVIYYITLLIIAFWPSGMSVFLIRSKRARTKLIVALIIFQILWLVGLYSFLISLITYLIDKTA